MSQSASDQPRKRRRSNMEFGFIVGEKAPRAHANRPRKTGAAGPRPEESKAEPQVVAPREAVESVSLSPEPLSTPTPKEKPTMSTPSTSASTPAPIRTSSIERQIKEQKTVNNVLNGVALAIICGVLLVAALAGTGGYVLWKQMQDQSASLALLEQNTKDRMFDLKAELIASDTDLAKSQEQMNLRVAELTSQFETYRSETSQMLAELRANNRSLERSLSFYQKKLDQQDMQLAQLRRR
ncbi:MAG: hypothetical protein HC904_11095 [Blastochloris sp.]|nr:hypothetical protein [Blastochloris sp.]